MDYQTLAKKLTTSNPKTIYDGVFSSSSHPQSSPGAIDDYREIFLGSTNTSNNESSIPFLDIPEQSKTTSVDFKNNNNNKSFVDYSNVFGGFEDFDGALSYEDVIVNDKPKPKPKMKKYAATGFVSMELEPMNSASMASSLKGSDDLDSLGGNQMKSDQESYQSFVGTKQFNMPYRKTSPGLSNGANATHIAELNAVSGYTYLVDGGSHKPTTKGDKSILSGGENDFSDSDLSRQMGDFNSLNKETSKTLWADANEVPSGGSVKVQNKHSQNKSSSNDSLFDACDVNSKDDLPKESPPNLQPNLGIARDDFKKSTIPKHGMPRTTGSEKTKGVFSPPDLDEEMDENSIAAAPAAALKLAIAKAQARIKIAKESKEKKGNLRSSVKPSIKDGPRSGERKETIVAYKANNMSENKAQEISGKANSWMQGFTGLWNQKATKASQVGPGSGDRMKNPDMEGPTKEAPVQRVRSIPVEHRQHTTEEQKAEKLPEPSCVRFVHADHAKQMTQSSNEYLIKEVKTNEKRTEKPVGYDKSCNLVDKISTDGKHESEPNVVHKAVGPRFSDSFKVPDVKGPTREEAHVQRSRSPEVERSRCSIEEQEIGNLTELSSLGFEEADNAMHVMQSSNKYTRNGVMMTEEKKEEPVEHGNVFVNNVCIDEQSENEHNVSDDAEWHQVHENKLNTSKEHIYIENQTMTVGITTEQEETAEKSLETSPEEEFCEKIHMLNQPIKIEMEDEHQEVREVEYTEVVEILEQIESKKEEEVAFEQVESKNYLDDAPNREQNETVSKTPCGLNSWEEITEGPYQIESETPLVFEEEEGDNNHIYAPRRSDRAEKLDLLHGQQILAGNDGDLHVMEQIENIKPAVLEDFAEDKTLEEEKENGYMLQQICQPKDNWKRETASQKGVESDTIQADINPKSGVEAKEEVCQYEYKQNFGENLSEIQGAAQRWVEADKVQADVNLKPGDEATQEVCSDQQNKQERDDDECKEDHGENFSKIQEFYVPTKTYEHVEVIPEILTRENNGTVVEVSEAPDKPMMKKVESKPVDQIKEVEEECETESADSMCSATEFNKFKEQMDGVSEADLVQRQQEQCNEDSAVGNVGCESSKRTGRDRDVQVSFRQEQDQATSEERLIDHGQCMEAAQSPCMPTEILEETHSNEEIGYGDIKEKIKENHKILEETMDATQQEMEFKKQRLAKKDEAKRMEREKEKQRIAVERAMREARERAFAEARRKIMSEARERPEKIPAGTNERMFGDKATTEAKLKAERAAVERATAEARERALKKALSDKAGMGSRKQANVNEIRRTFSSTDSQHYGSVPSSSSRYSNPSNYGVPSSSERLDGVNVESAQRCKARLERHQRTAERAAKALAEKNMRDLLAQKEQQERNRLAEALDADIKRWSSGKEKNLRALLSTLQYILGPDSGWQPISLTDLVTSAAVKKAYRKSTLYVHPDKLQQRGASIQKKYICEKVFDLLKEAYNRFSAEER